MPDSGYAVVGSNRPKLGRFGGDAPAARASVGNACDGDDGVSGGGVHAAAEDPGVRRLLRGTEQLVPFSSSKKAKRRIKNGSGVNTAAAFRWA